jgi:hypothetical protein
VRSSGNSDRVNSSDHVPALDLDASTMLKSAVETLKEAVSAEGEI